MKSILSALLILGCLFISGCSCPGLPLNSTLTPVTGSLTLGETQEEAIVPIPPEGTLIAIERPGDPLNGFELDIPSGSYPAQLDFSISYNPINSHNFGGAFNPLTPLINIDNGGEYSEEIMTLKIPVIVPQGHFAMGFFYDSVSRKLEGIPTAAQDAQSITLATRHFSSIVISSISDALLKKDIDSGFRPAGDDWQFTNYGSYIAPFGHCTGQSMSAMWYYLEQPEGPGKPLFNRFDNNGNQPGSPKFQYDDSLSYRLASVVWKDMDWNSLSRRVTEKLISRSDEATYKLFAYSMQMSGEPQMTEIWDTVNGGGHAVVVYRIQDGKMLIADPNFPGDSTRQIDYTGGSFRPYFSGSDASAIAAGLGVNYDRITYVAKTSLVDWDKMSQRWKEFKAKTIGDGLFPDYTIVYLDDKGVEHSLMDGYTSSSSLINIYDLQG
jgi:hypothetical protein